MTPLHLPTSTRPGTGLPAGEAWQPVVDSTDPWFRRYPVERPVARLVCLPHAGGTAGVFHSWPQSLAPGIEMLAVRYPGRQDRLDDPFPQSLEDLAEEIAGHLLQYLDLPVALFGHSMGSAVAYEVARRLEAWKPDALARLFVSGRAAPTDGPRGTGHLSDDETLAAWAAGLGGPAAEVYADPELRYMLLFSLRGDLRLLDTYRPSELVPLHAPITAFGGTDDLGYPPEELSTWSKVAKGAFDARSFNGDHFYLVPHAASLVEEICSRIPR
ncbi:thioesterase II family protein [Streptomyces sp. NBC_01217]|uniref:thioesterase II family protein n=1 Tax=Streptomyces sp. NBC_01217 TaxID=2903779 RepID=UPI002E103832|nr:alpha/beta fold hydrolase [Streptomyces sp. NBC_01217]